MDDHEWVISHIWTSHTGQRTSTLMSHVRPVNKSLTNESCHTYEWVVQDKKQDYTTLALTPDLFAPAAEAFLWVMTDSYV